MKLMGRQSGFIATYASIASGEVDLCLIPEVPFVMDGPNGVLAHVEYLLEAKGHAIVCLAEGAGQEYVTTVRGSGGCRAEGGEPLAPAERPLVPLARRCARAEAGAGDSESFRCDPTDGGLFLLPASPSVRGQDGLDPSGNPILGDIGPWFSKKAREMASRAPQLLSWALQSDSTAAAGQALM